MQKLLLVLVLVFSACQKHESEVPQAQEPTFDSERCRNGVLDPKEECDVENEHDYTCATNDAYCWRCNHVCERRLRFRSLNIPKGLFDTSPQLSPALKRIDINRDGASSTITIESDARARIQKITERFQNKTTVNEWRLTYDSMGHLATSAGFIDNKSVHFARFVYDSNKLVKHFLDADGDGIFENQTHYIYGETSTKKVFDEHQKLKSENRIKQNEQKQITYRYSDRQGKGAPDIEAFYTYSKGVLRHKKWDLGADGDYERVTRFDKKQRETSLGSSITGFHTKEVTRYAFAEKPLLSYDIDLNSKRVENVCHYKYTNFARLESSYCLDGHGHKNQIVKQEYQRGATQMHLKSKSVDVDGDGKIDEQWHLEVNDKRRISKTSKEERGQKVWVQQKDYDSDKRLRRSHLKHLSVSLESDQTRELTMHFFYNDELWRYAKEHAPDAIAIERTF